MEFEHEIGDKRAFFISEGLYTFTMPIEVSGARFQRIDTPCLVIEALIEKRTYHYVIPYAGPFNGIYIYKLVDRWRCTTLIEYVWGPV